MDRTSTSTSTLGAMVIAPRERFQKWVLSTEHPAYGWLDGHWLRWGDDREGYANEYVQGLWVAFKEFSAIGEQMTEVGGEPDVQRYSLIGKCLSENSPGEGGAWMKYADHRNVVAPLQAEIERMHASYETVHEVMVRQRARIAELESQRGEPVAKVVSKFGDPEVFGEREVVLLSDISQIPYDTPLYR